MLDTLPRRTVLRIFAWTTPLEAIVGGLSSRLLATVAAATLTPDLELELTDGGLGQHLLRNSPPLSRLRLARCDFPLERFAPMSETLRASASTLRALDISETLLAELPARALPATLRVFACAGCAISAACLADVARTLRSLVALDASRTRLTDEARPHHCASLLPSSTHSPRRRGGNRAARRPRRSRTSRPRSSA